MKTVSNLNPTEKTFWIHAFKVCSQISEQATIVVDGGKRLNLNSTWYLSREFEITPTYKPSYLVEKMSNCWSGPSFMSML